VPAQLKRARSAPDVACIDAFHRLAFRLRPAEQIDAYAFERLALLASVLAQVDGHDGSKGLPAQMARKKGGDPVVSGLRFRRLLQRDYTELAEALRRMVRLIGGQANILDISRAIWYWGDQVKRDWALSYFSIVSDQSKRK
jgi:CRISPR system Cascade subunit CasB